MRHRQDGAGERVRQLVEEGLTIEEVGFFLKCSESTIYKNFGEEIKEGRFLRDSCLRKKQVELAKGGNPTMLIWLGKQLLGQKDQKEVTGHIEHEHIDLTPLSDDSIRQIASLVESASGGV